MTASAAEALLNTLCGSCPLNFNGCEQLSRSLSVSNLAYVAHSMS